MAEREEFSIWFQMDKLLTVGNFITQVQNTSLQYLTKNFNWRLNGSVGH
jgi:hypothetical protein